MKTGNKILSFIGGATLLYNIGCQTPHRSLLDRVNESVVQTRASSANVNSGTDVNYQGIFDSAQRARTYLDATTPVNSALGTRFNIADVRSALATDVSTLEHGLRGAKGRVYALVNGYRSSDGVSPITSNNAQPHFWLYGTSLSTQELADVLAGTSRDPVLDQSEVVNLARNARTQFTPIPQGRVTHHDRLGEYGWVVLPQAGSRNLDLRLLDFISRYGLTTSSYDGQVSGPTYTLADLQAMKTNGNPTRLYPNAPFAIQLVIEEAPIGTPAQQP